MSYVENFWRPATAADVARVIAGEVVEARFRDHDPGSWLTGKLRGVKIVSGVLHWMTSGASWTFCQVYAPPQWFLNKPEPGEGYRLLEKFPDEPVQGGDFAFDRSGGWIELRSECGPTQAEGIWYRRRIEPPKPVPKFKVGQRVKIIGPKRTEKVRYNWEQGMDNQVGKTGVVTGSHDGSFGRLYQLSGIVEWNFQEDYLEPVVEPEPKHYVLKVGDTAETGNGFSLIVTEHGVEVT